MKTTKILACAASLTLIGACGAALVACGDSSTVETYTIEIRSEDYAEWSQDNEQPLDMGSGHRLWGLSTWSSSSTKSDLNDDGVPAGGTYKYVLEIDENCIAPGFLSYRLTFSGVVPPNPDSYKEPSTLVYSYEGYAYAIDGGYQLLVPHFAEGSMTSECISETLSNSMGDGSAIADADSIEYVIMDGPNGGDLYYCYTNSIIQSMGTKYSVPFMDNLLGGMSACKVKVSGSSITSFENDDIYAQVPELKIPEGVGSGSGSDGEEEGDWTDLDPIEDDNVKYDFAPMWSTNTNLGAPLDPDDAEIVVVAGAYNTFEMQGKEMGWNNVQVTFTFTKDGKVTIAMLNNQGKTDTYTGTYKCFAMMNTPQYLIQLDNVAGQADPNDANKIEGAVNWAECAEADQGQPGAKVGWNIFYWISKDGKICLSKMPDAASYGFNVSGGGGDNPDAPGGGDHEGTPPFAGGDHEEGGAGPRE